MRFLVDECTGPAVASWLHEKGFEVFSVFDDDRGADDDFLRAWGEKILLSIQSP